jgi:predicted nucleic acid-binding protein
MMLVDTSILLDVLTNDRRWAEWSITALRMRTTVGPLLINEVVYAEMAGHVDNEAELDASVERLDVHIEWTPKSALFLAGDVFRRYRRSGGTRTGVLPDFFLGAHAQIAGLPLLTRDTGRFRTYFPDVELITP